MKKFLRRLRGTVGTALTWAGTWCGAGMLIGTTGLFGDLALADYALFGGVFAVLGLVSGAAFALVLSLVEGRRSIDELTLPRVAVWGVAAGAVLQLVMVAVGQGAGLPTWVFFMLLSSISAVACLSSVAASTLICPNAPAASVHTSTRLPSVGCAGRTCRSQCSKRRTTESG